MAAEGKTNPGCGEGRGRVPVVAREELQFHESRFKMFLMDKLCQDAEAMGQSEVIALTLGKSEAELPIPQPVIDTMKEAMDDYNKLAYVVPQGIPELREELANFYWEEYKVKVSANQFVVNIGSSAIFRNIFNILVRPGDEVLLPKPYYPMYVFTAKLTGATIKYYNVNQDDELTIDWDSVRDNFSDKTRLVIICHPGNPLGNTLVPEDLVKFDDIIQGRCPVINDEIYAGCCFDGSPTVLQMLNRLDLKTTFITTSAFSKMFRMYARRVGWALVPPELVEPLTTVQHHTLLCCDPILQLGGVEALKHRDAVHELRDTYHARRDFQADLFKGLEEVGVRLFNSKGGFHSSVDVGQFMDQNGYESSYQLALSIFCFTRVAVTPGSDFGLPRALRMSFSHGRYNEGIKRIVGFFTKNTKVVPPNCALSHPSVGTVFFTETEEEAKLQMDALSACQGSLYKGVNLPPTGEGDTVFDLNAGHGIFSLYYAKLYPQARVVAINTNKGIAEWSARNAEHNSTANIKSVHVTQEWAIDNVILHLEKDAPNLKLLRWHLSPEDKAKGPKQSFSQIGPQWGAAQHVLLEGVGGSEVASFGQFLSEQGYGSLQVDVESGILKASK